MRRAGSGHAPTVRIAVWVHFAVSLLVCVVDDALLVCQVHRARPVSEIVDHKQPAPTAGL